MFGLETGADGIEMFKIKNFKPMVKFEPPISFQPKECIKIDPCPKGVPTPNHFAFYSKG